ncbi:hypothetical protein [Ascidiimonas aurantiaca]|uniref:hypothetical protein n=1 Tax=Ascidiimonas aurantiaca TaxID=1685432 RepID=UPI0030EE844A
MKAFLQTTSVLVIILAGFSNCAGSKKLQETLPFTLGEVYAQKWTGGARGSGSGVNFFVAVNNLPEGLQLDSVYFRGKKVTLEAETVPKGQLFVGRFLNTTAEKHDLIMHADPKKEVGNKPPVVKEKIPFELTDDQAVISYRYKNRKYYYKIENVVEKRAEAYPSAPVKKGL